MSMLEIIKEAVDSNPSASKEAVGEAVIDYIEAILPKIVRTIRTPITPSPLEMKRREFRLQRMPRRSRTTVRGMTREQEQFVREIASLRRVLDGGPSPNLWEVASRGDEDSQLTPTAMSSHDFWFPPSIGIDGITSSDIFPKQLGMLPRQIVSFSPYVAGVREAEEPLLPRFTVDLGIEERIASDSVFAEFFRIVEETVRRFAQVSGLRWEFEGSSPTDLETPWWKRIILRIKPLGTEFDKSMELWDRIDAEVREAIESASARTPATDSETIRELNKNFFVEMDLG